ncbi:ABC transporter permease [Salinivirga cyanobacteriivorans]|uniref:ABC-2 family transporter protein n=1 Tax=Salinivirga cyanobacteriivorans TaxID=1307839 RepID=A0A0S2HWT6_9BACT|nr:ABC transporter permease [Salinivirga cyanobacteriivorans]ALO14332.1 ABC-2 family transporter protein [Salinivirga cyanobacteriivorans]
MNKAKYIVKREYISRVKKKTFLLMTLIGPVLFAGLLAAPVWFATMEDSETKHIAVIDSSGIFDYTKVLKESITLNSRRFQSELDKYQKNLPPIGSEMKNLNDKLHLIANNRDTLMGKNLKLGFINEARKIKKAHNLPQQPFDSLATKYANLLPLINQRLNDVKGRISNTSSAIFHFKDFDYKTSKEAIRNGDYYGAVFIPSNVLSSLKIQTYAQKSLSMGLRSHIKNSIEREIENQKLRNEGIDQETLKNMKTSINVASIKITEDGEEKEARPEIAMIIGYVAGFLIYISIFMFGSQVMRGVIEEKTSRIVEVILSSVKPMQLLMGKVLGVGLVGLTQYLIWIIMTGLLTFGAFTFLVPSDVSQLQQQATDFAGNGGMQNMAPVVEGNMGQIQDIIASITSVNWPLILGTFLFFFIGGYMLYAALFAAVGSAVDNETDTQQFMAPITIPLILALFVMINTINNPESALTFWFSIIPLTSPIVMLVRIPFGVPVWELALSMGLLAITFIAMIWLASRIYKTGILMFGSKVSYKELWKWIKIKD